MFKFLRKTWPSVAYEQGRIDAVIYGENINPFRVGSREYNDYEAGFKDGIK